jgi:hypothetical protein
MLLCTFGSFKGKDKFVFLDTMNIYGERRGLFPLIVYLSTDVGGGIPVPIECETGWVPEPVWAVLWTRKCCASAEIQFSGHLARG